MTVCEKLPSEHTHKPMIHKMLDGHDNYEIWISGREFCSIEDYKIMC